MPITERTLKKWRKEALKEKANILPCMDGARSWSRTPADYLEMQERILRLTQELLDQHLMRK